MTDRAANISRSILIVLLAALHFSGVQASCTPMRLLIHANIWHLLCNSLALTSLRRYLPMLPYLAITAGSALAGLYCDPQAIGISAALFAAVATSYAVKGFTRHSKYILGALAIASALLPNLSLAAHAIPFASAYTATKIYLYGQRYRHDTKG